LEQHGLVCFGGLPADLSPAQLPAGSGRQLTASDIETIINGIAESPSGNDIAFLKT
jgi:hypothetical protein